MDDPNTIDAALLRSLVHNSFDLTTISDREGNLRYVTPSVGRILGYSSEEVLGRNFMEFIHPEDAARVFESFARAINTPGTLDPTILRVRHSDGTWRVIEAAANNLLGDPAVAGIVHNMRDITGRHAAETAVRRNEQKLRAYLDQATDLIWTLDLHGRFTSVNAEVCATLGFEPEELIGRAALELVPPEHLAGLAVLLNNIIQGESIDQVEAEVVRKDGGRIWLEIRGRAFADEGSVVEILQIGRNITERRKAEEALRQSEALYRSILNSSPDAVAITDMSGRILLYSPEATVMFGFDVADDLSGRMVTEFIVPEDRDRAAANIFQMFIRDADRSLRRPDEYRAIRRDGSVFDVEVTGEIVRDAMDEPTGMVFDVRDISERKEAEAERGRLESRLHQSQKLEAVGQLAGGIAHDFNNMLGVILASAELALMSIDPAAPAREDIGEILRAAQRSADLTRQLLAFARRQVITPRYLELNDAIEPILRMLGRLIREDTTLDWKPGAAECWVYVDPGQVDQILANLVVNARDAIPGAGTITIATAVVDLPDPDVRALGGASPGQYVVLSVRDDGAGMDQATRERIFEPFFTTKPLGQGTGLGLATVYGIAHQNQGFVEVESEPGVGTQISVYLPRREPDLADPPATSPSADKLSGTETVLLVEDEPVLLRLTAKMLEGLGYTVLTSGTPDDALRLAAGYPGPINLLLSDMMMPGMNGVELWKQLRATRATLRCVFISGYPADVLGADARLPGSVDLLPKPYSRDALATKLRQVLAAI